MKINSSKGLMGKSVHSGVFLNQTVNIVKLMSFEIPKLIDQEETEVYHHLRGPQF